MWFTASRRSGCYLMLALGIAAPVLSGCGFRPLYASGGGSGEAVLATVEVLRIKDRTGQQLRNLLIERLSPRGRAGRTDYSLAVTLQESKAELAIKKDETATRGNLTIRANFKLVAQRDPRRSTFSGSAISTNSYNILASDFATLSAERDARDRALRTIAEEIRLRVAAALRSPGSFSVPPVENSGPPARRTAP